MSVSNSSRTWQLVLGAIAVGLVATGLANLPKGVGHLTRQ
jgi:hypothetical protein